MCVFYCFHHALFSSILCNSSYTRVVSDDTSRYRTLKASFHSGRANQLTSIFGVGACWCRTYNASLREKDVRQSTISMSKQSNGLRIALALIGVSSDTKPSSIGGATNLTTIQEKRLLISWSNKISWQADVMCRRH